MIAFYNLDWVLLYGVCIAMPETMQHCHYLTWSITMPEHEAIAKDDTRSGLPAFIFDLT